MAELKNDVRGKLSLEQVQYDYATALLAYEAGMYEGAVEKFKKALGRLSPNHAPQFYYALSLLKTGRNSEAIAELQRVTRWYPNGVTVLPINGAFLPTASCWPIASVKAHYWLAVA
jgi:tetratricopeptide (TPR) repeat protein